MRNEISIYTGRDFEVQFEAVLHDSHINNFHTYYPGSKRFIADEARSHDLLLNFLTKKEPQSVEKELNRILHERNIPQTRYQIHRRAYDDEIKPKKSKKDFTPINVGHRLKIMPAWDKTSVKTGETLVSIDPGIALSVEEETTIFLGLEVMMELVRDGKRVLDLGAGSGATAISAVKLGAGSVDALVNDPELMKYTSSNIHRNNCDEKVNVFYGGYDAVPHNDYQIVLAQIDVDDIMECFDSITKKMTKMKYLVLSGIHQSRKGTLNSFLVDRELHPSIILQKKEWCTYLLRTKRGW